MHDNGPEGVDLGLLGCEFRVPGLRFGDVCEDKMPVAGLVFRRKS
jgi:hypothetical protein